MIFLNIQKEGISGIKPDNINTHKTLQHVFRTSCLLRAFKSYILLTTFKLPKNDKLNDQRIFRRILYRLAEHKYNDNQISISYNVDKRSIFCLSIK